MRKLKSFNRIFFKPQRKKKAGEEECSKFSYRNNHPNVNKLNLPINFGKNFQLTEKYVLKIKYYTP